MNILSGHIKGGQFVSLRGASFQLPASAFLLRDGMNAVLGLRPTDLFLGPARPGEASLSGSVSRVEYGGADMFVDLALSEAERLRIRALLEKRVSVGDRIEARIALTALHLFDAEGASLRRPAP
jgi:multiple sugar transport system ATP-binding protein